MTPTTIAVCVCLVAVLCFACHDADTPPVQPPPSTQLDGVYDVLSITCDLPVDLDRDGIKTLDLLAETHEASNTHKYYMELSTTVYHWKPDYYDQQVSVFRPWANVLHELDGTFIGVRYGFTNLLARYRLDEATGEISTFRNIGNGEILGMEQLDETTLKVRFTARYFTSNDAWEDLMLTGTYVRRR